MKKILTLLFFAGFLTTAAFAQDGGRHRQYDNQYNNDRNSSYGNRGDGDGYNHQWQDRRGDDRHDRDEWDHERRERWDRDRDGWDGDGDRRFHRHYRDYDHDREVIAYPYGYGRPMASVQIVIGRRH
ncbi:hypothetical protein FW778_18990 [Ginsengibacter hankyongi]|uniref:Uncharacterized protein n=1 Tax=Ginsengibacter hankyongi TaxID=2607284 RepID=A0A5J5ID42_9BACT|nr:hypothetical protein [Ginsengibacter hankyongi]KAA9036323.1 hypothetical protein FW778_18990 [Ginsengibacter hankyongi]